MSSPDTLTSLQTLVVQTVTQAHANITIMNIVCVCILLAIAAFSSAFAVSTVGRAYLEASSRQPELRQYFNTQAIIFSAFADTFCAVAAGIALYCMISSPFHIDPERVNYDVRVAMNGCEVKVIPSTSQ